MWIDYPEPVQFLSLFFSRFLFSPFVPQFRVQTIHEALWDGPGHTVPNDLLSAFALGPWLAGTGMPAELQHACQLAAERHIRRRIAREIR